MHCLAPLESAYLWAEPPTPIHAQPTCLDPSSRAEPRHGFSSGTKDLMQVWLPASASSPQHTFLLRGPCVESSPSQLLSCREPGTRDENLSLPWVSVMRWSMFPAGGWRDVTRSEGVWCQDLNCDILQLPRSIGGGLLWVS